MARFCTAARLLLICLLIFRPVEAKEPSGIELASLSLEELMNIEVSLVSRKAEKIFQAAAAVSVLTREDLRRSGATSIPEALRLVPGMQVGRIDANKWAVSARGFNGRFARQLLVLVDGRSAYTPLFSGVYWEMQDVLLEDVERIEVIRGPGATLWGANAVNGIINIITQNTRETQGGRVTLGSGTEERGFGSLRFGGKLKPGLHFRLYGKYFSRDRFVDAAGEEIADDWDMLRGGFRGDWEMSPRSSLTLQGDLYDGKAGQTFRFPSMEPPYRYAFDDRAVLRGGNLLGSWKRQFSDSSDMALQVYYDRIDREEAVLTEERDTYDLDFQHRFGLGTRQEVLWGLGYHLTRDALRGSSVASFTPERRGIDLFSAFLQNELSLVEERLRLTVGAKFERNDQTGFEYQPSARLLWTPSSRQSIWAAVSRALRIPSRADEDVRLPLLVFPPDSLFTGSPPTLAVGFGQRGMKAEKLYAFELGYRFHPTQSLLVDMAGFINEYREMRTGEVGAPYGEEADGISYPVLPVYWKNLLDARTYGVELAADWRPVEDRWRLRAAYTYLHMDFHLRPGADSSSDRGAGENPEHQLMLWSALDLRPDLRLDGILRYVDRLPTLDIDAYLVADLRLAWEPSGSLEIALVGRNLLEKHHPEFQAFFVDTLPTRTQHEIYATVRWRFAGF